MDSFNKGIKKMIEKFSYEVFIVKQDFRKPCACVDFVTKQADLRCKKCLGTGYKVKIKKMRTASEDSKGSFKNAGLEERTLAMTYYVDAKYPMEEANIIVDDGEAYIVHRLEKKKTANKELVYYKVFGASKKSYHAEFIKNFESMIRRASNG